MAKRKKTERKTQLETGEKYSMIAERNRQKKEKIVEQKDSRQKDADAIAKKNFKIKERKGRKKLRRKLE